MSSLLPLLPRTDWGGVVAWRKNEPVTLEAFVASVCALADRLPAGAHVLNLCSDRYAFTLGFFATVKRGLVSLLPNAVTTEMITELQSSFGHVVCIIEKGGDSRGLPAIEIGDEPRQARRDMPQIPTNQVVARVFTSGSTGKPQAHDKTWGKLVRNILGGAGAIRQAIGRIPNIIGTVPAQHMYGFESSVLLPALGGGALQAMKPFFPADIVASLEATPRPRMLVTTPFHLRTLLDAGLDMPALDLVLSATAPLSLSLAQRAEESFGAPLLEIYGSTETGQLATRRPTAGAEWNCFEGITLEQLDDAVWASGGHIEIPVPLNDVVDLQTPSRFVLLGRHSDLINIAGKRTSLAYLNHVLTGLPGVSDGAFYLPEYEPADGIARLTAFVVAKDRTSREILDALRERLDAVFMPRPLVMVDTLPRNTTGKLPLAALKSLAESSSANMGDDSVAVLADDPN